MGDAANHNERSASDELRADLRALVDELNGVQHARVALDGVSREAIERALAGLPQRAGTLHLIRARIDAFRSMRTVEMNERGEPTKAAPRPRSKSHEQSTRE